ncbi:MAG: hypothetical protein KKA81_15345 [Bacteroidetes bacterium]|nr:hypothetical protein [Bacteroidota bacterium]
MSELDFNRNPGDFSAILEDGLIHPFEEHQRIINNYLENSLPEDKKDMNREAWSDKVMRWFGVSLTRN